MSLLQAPLTGMKLYILKERANAESIWKLLKKNRITSASFTPAMLRQLKEVYTEKFSSLPVEERQKYLDGFNSLVNIRCGGAMVSPTTRTFWTSMTGRPFQNIYALTECGCTVLQTNTDQPTDLEVCHHDSVQLSTRAKSHHKRTALGRYSDSGSRGKAIGR